MSAASILGRALLGAMIGVLVLVPLWWITGQLAPWREVLRELPIVIFALALVWTAGFLLLGSAFWLEGRRARRKHR